MRKIDGKRKMTAKRKGRRVYVEEGREQGVFADEEEEESDRRKTKK